MLVLQTLKNIVPIMIVSYISKTRIFSFFSVVFICRNFNENSIVFIKKNCICKELYIHNVYNNNDQKYLYF